MHRLNQQDAELVSIFHMLSDARRELALDLMRRFSGVAGSTETRIIVGTSSSSSQPLQQQT